MDLAQSCKHNATCDWVNNVVSVDVRTLKKKQNYEYWLFM